MLIIAAMRHHAFARILLLFLLGLLRSFAATEDFSGVWKTSYGMMRLSQDGEEVTGCYTLGEQTEITGSVDLKSVV